MLNPTDPGLLSELVMGEDCSMEMGDDPVPRRRLLMLEDVNMLHHDSPLASVREDLLDLGLDLPGKPVFNCRLSQRDGKLVGRSVGRGLLRTCRTRRLASGCLSRSTTTTGRLREGPCVSIPCKWKCISRLRNALCTRRAELSFGTGPWSCLECERCLGLTVLLGFPSVGA